MDSSCGRFWWSRLKAADLGKRKGFRWHPLPFKILNFKYAVKVWSLSRFYCLRPHRHTARDATRKNNSRRRHRNTVVRIETNPSAVADANRNGEDCGGSGVPHGTKPKTYGWCKRVALDVGDAASSTGLQHNSYAINTNDIGKATGSH
ncbi:hypothetical protein E3N88_32495 [Mikania micrantha]|uniref:Uncharacterized protein n=1 Tax=Mikania micrantha TaxID=192012 RepID=A0A5N6M8J7_9ASTR|nr:hypothetical protein E3N88_32495 [Mikania micrantha]